MSSYPAASTQTRIEADDRVPVTRLFREFDAAPELVFRAHTDPDLFARWIGPHRMRTTIEHWDCRTGGSWRYTCSDADGSYSFRGCFHAVAPPTAQQEACIVQTFTFEGFPDGVSLERLTLEDLGAGRTGLVASSLVESFEARDAILASGMEHGVNEGYQKLDAVLMGLPPGLRDLPPEEAGSRTPRQG